MQTYVLRIGLVCGPLLAFSLFYPPAPLLSNGLITATASATVSAAPTTYPSVQLGLRQTYLSSGQDGFTFFPDEPVSVLQTPQDSGLYWVYIVANASTYLVKGKSLTTLDQPTPVLIPSGSGFDGQYAGVGAVVKTGPHSLLAFYHGEDHTGLPKCANNRVGFYASVMLAISDDNGLTLKRVGPVLQGTPKDATSSSCSQGDGDPSVIVDKTNTYLYAYYTDHCDCDRGVQIGMARSSLDQHGQPGTWLKYKDGAFNTSGLGSHDITPVIQAPSAPKADAHGPNVVYSPTLNLYIMIYNVNAYHEISQQLPPNESGVYVAYSQDGITWTGQQELIKLYTVPIVGQAWGGRPSLYLSQLTTTTVSGTLLYTYSEKWPTPPHYLVGQSVVFTKRD